MQQRLTRSQEDGSRVKAQACHSHLNETRLRKIGRMNQLKFRTAFDASDAIVVSFHAKWRELFMQNAVKRIFRRRAPRTAPTQMYVYIGSPVSAIIGRCTITDLDWLPVEDVLALSSEGALSRDELSQYIGNYQTLAVYSVRPIEVCRRSLPLSILKERFSFSPPQSFFALSRAGQQALDDAAEFIRRTPRDRRT
jgi:predicted transcriptional regulator